MQHATQHATYNMQRVACAGVTAPSAAAEDLMRCTLRVARPSPRGCLLSVARAVAAGVRSLRSAPQSARHLVQRCRQQVHALVWTCACGGLGCCKCARACGGRRAEGAGTALIFVASSFFSALFVLRLAVFSCQAHPYCHNSRLPSHPVPSVKATRFGPQTEADPQPTMPAGISCRPGVAPSA